MLIRKIILLLSIVLCTLNVNGQNQVFVDSVLQNMSEKRDTHRLYSLTDLFMEYIYVDYDKARSYAAEHLDIAEELGYPEWKGLSYNLLGTYYNITSNYEASIETFNKAIDAYTEAGDLRYVSLVLNNMSNSNRELGRLEEALENQMQSLKLKEELELNDEDTAPSYWNIGNIQSDIGNLTESNVWYRKALKIYEKLEYEEDVVDLNYNLYLNLKLQDSLDEALPYLYKYIDFKREKNRMNDVAGGLDNLAQLYYEKGDLINAEKYYHEGLDISLKNGEKSLPGIFYRRLANVNLKKGNPDKALRLAFKALEISNETGVDKKKITDYKVISEVYEAKGQYSKALEYYKYYHELNDSILSLDAKNAINELEIKYQTEKKEQEIVIQENKIQILEQKAEIAKIRQWALVVGIIILLVLLTAIYYALKQRLKTQQLEKDKIERELDFKKQELLAFTTQLAHKNEILESLKGNLEEIKTNTQGGDINKVIRSIDFNLNDESTWDSFKTRFEEVHKDFSKNLLNTHQKLTPGEIRLSSLLRMELNSREIANLLNISQEGIKKARYRLRKKLELESDDSLEKHLMQF